MNFAYIYILAISRAKEQVLLVSIDLDLTTEPIKINCHKIPDFGCERGPTRPPDEGYLAASQTPSIDEGADTNRPNPHRILGQGVHDHRPSGRGCRSNEQRSEILLYEG